MLTPVKREQFELVSDVETVHLPTGARFSVYRYDAPENIFSDIRVNWGSAGDVLKDGRDFSRDEILQVASQILLEQARKATRKVG